MRLQCVFCTVFVFSHGKDIKLTAFVPAYWYLHVQSSQSFYCLNFVHLYYFDYIIIIMTVLAM